MRGMILLTLLGALFVTACSAFGPDPTPDYRYRLTVEIETPQGLRSGSSVIEVEQSMGRTAMGGFGERINYRVRGEAVAVDLPDGRTLYALLRSDNNVDWASYVMQMLAPDIEGEPWERRFDNVLLIEGEVEVPRTFPPVGHLEERSAYPMLVTFANERDPTSVELVDPDDLAATFGAGTSLKRITAEITNDAVTTGIERRLGWLSYYPEPSLKPDHDTQDYSLAATLKHRAFRQRERQ